MDKWDITELVVNQFIYLNSECVIQKLYWDVAKLLFYSDAFFTLTKVDDRLIEAKSK